MAFSAAPALGFFPPYLFSLSAHLYYTGGINHHDDVTWWRALSQARLGVPPSPAVNPLIPINALLMRISFTQHLIAHTHTSHLFSQLSHSHHTHIRISSRTHTAVGVPWHVAFCKASQWFVSFSFTHSLSTLYSSGVAIAVHICSTNISEWHRGNAERASASCWQKEGDLNRFEPRAHTGCQTPFHLLWRAAH